MSMTIKSELFLDRAAIPVGCTEDGEDRSPALAWAVVPKGTVEFALIVDDPDAPAPEPWVHWVLAKIPASAAGLAAGYRELSTPGDSPAGLVQGLNTWGTVGYRGPAPPPGHGTHHYHFKLFALDEALDVPQGVDKHTLLEAISGHVLGRAELVGTYQR